MMQVHSIERCNSSAWVSWASGTMLDNRCYDAGLWDWIVRMPA